MVNCQLTIFLFHLLKTLSQICCAKFFNFCFIHSLLHVLRWIVITTYDKLGYYWKFLSCKTKCFFCDFVANAFNFDKDTSRSYRSNKTFRRTFTFTHTDFSRFLCDRLVREDANPDLSLTLHITGYSDTGCFNLTSGNPL